MAIDFIKDYSIWDWAALKGAAENISSEIDRLCKPGREKALAITSLEQALMWAFQALPSVDADGDDD